MPEQRNYRFAQDTLEMGSAGQAAGILAPSSPEAAMGQASIDLMKPGAAPVAIEGIINQARQIASNKQELISKIIKPMKGLDDTPPASGARSPAEKYADDIISKITAESSIPEDAAIAMILKTWPFWSQKLYTWDTFLNFISKAAKTFSNPQDVLEWSKNLFASMQDGAPVFTPDYIMNVALDAINTGNFTKYQNLLISLPFYKSVWSQKPIDSNEFSKSVSQISSVMELTRTPTEDMNLVLRNMKAQNELITEFSYFYKSFLDWLQAVNITELENAKKEIKGKVFDAAAWMQGRIRVELKRKALTDTITKGLIGLEVLGIEPEKKKTTRGSIKLFKTVLASGGSTGAPAAGSGSSSTPASGSGSTSGTGTSTSTTSTPLSDSQQKASNQANALNREALLIDKNQEIIQKKIEKINSISEGKAKGLTGDLGLFSSLVTSGNVVKEINETLKLIADQRVLIKNAIAINDSWINRNPINSTTPDALAAHHQTLSMNRKRYQVLGIELDGMEQALKIQRIVLPKELEYFELKEEYDTNVEQLKAPISALMVNSLKTTTDNKGRTTTINTRVARPIAIKNAWETGKKIVNLLMQISQALQAGTGHSAMGESMAKNASNYYKAAIKQEVENNKMLMDNLRDIGLGGGQVNYTPVAVGKK